MMVATSAEQVATYYSQAYHKLYKRTPKDLRILDGEWVVVNGARMRVIELEYLAAQLQREYTQGIEKKRSMVRRLLNWFQQ
jgi:hypothetical protein